MQWSPGFVCEKSKQKGKANEHPHTHTHTQLAYYLQMADLHLHALNFLLWVVNIMIWNCWNHADNYICRRKGNLDPCSSSNNAVVRDFLPLRRKDQNQIVGNNLLLSKSISKLICGSPMWPYCTLLSKTQRTWSFLDSHTMSVFEQCCCSGIRLAIK